MKNSPIARFETQCNFEGANIDYDIKFNDTSRMHCHNFFEVFCVLNGKYNHTINNKKEIITEGNGYFLAPDCVHKLRGESSQVSRINIVIKKNFFKKACNYYSDTLYDEITSLNNAKISMSNEFHNKLISYLSTRDENDASGKNSMIEKYAVNMIVEMIIDTINIIQDEAPSWFKELTSKMHRSENIKWGVEDVVKNSNYSKTHMERMFKKHTGKTIIQYLTTIKMDLATKYLVNSSMSANDIAIALGYDNYTYFVHLFKKTFNMSPSQYRKVRIKYV